MTSLQVTLVSFGVVALGSTSLAATERRAEACYLIETVQQGQCTGDAFEMCEAIKAQFGCAGEVVDATCKGDPEQHWLRCVFPS